MLTEQEQHEIAEAISHTEDQLAALPDALKIVQRRRGWVSDEDIADVAAYFGVSPARVDEIATCYTVIYRQPVGRHVILLCNSISCWMMGEETLYGRLRDRLGVEFGGTTADGRFTLLPAVCLGACDRAPAMMIDIDLHGELTPEKLDTILERYP